MERSNYSHSYSFLMRAFKIPTSARECLSWTVGGEESSVLVTRLRKLKSGLCLDSFTAPEGRPRVVGEKEEKWGEGAEHRGSEGREEEEEDGSPSAFKITYWQTLSSSCFD